MDEKQAVACQATVSKSVHCRKLRKTSLEQTTYLPYQSYKLGSLSLIPPRCDFDTFSWGFGWLNLGVSKKAVMVITCHPIAGRSGALDDGRRCNSDFLNIFKNFSNKNMYIYMELAVFSSVVLCKFPLLHGCYPSTCKVRF